MQLQYSYSHYTTQKIKRIELAGWLKQEQRIQPSKKTNYVDPAQNQIGEMATHNMPQNL